VLERTWDDSTKLPEKYTFQGRKNGQKAEICIDSCTLGMEFFLDRTLPQFNQAGAKLEWGWPEMFLEFEIVLGDSYRTTWLEVLVEHYPEPLDEDSSSHRKTKEDFDCTVGLFIKKTLDNDKPRDLQYIYMQPSGDYRLMKVLVTPPRLHAQRLKEMFLIAKILPAGNIPKPLDALALQWYYMSYHNSDHEKFVLGGKTLKDTTVEMVNKFFQALYEQKKLDGSLDRQEVKRLKKCLLCKASEDLLCKVRDAANDCRTYRAKREIARRNDQRCYDVDHNQDRRQYIDDNRDDNGRCSSREPSKQPRDKRRSEREKNRDHNNQPSDRKLALAGQAKGNSGTPCALHNYPDRPAKHAWADCLENLANQKKLVKKEQAYTTSQNCRPSHLRIRSYVGT
jgi:hypothetical protein